MGNRIELFSINRDVEPFGFRASNCAQEMHGANRFVKVENCLFSFTRTYEHNGLKLNRRSLIRCINSIIEKLKETAKSRNSAVININPLEEGGRFLGGATAEDIKSTIYAIASIWETYLPTQIDQCFSKVEELNQSDTAKSVSDYDIGSPSSSSPWQARINYHV